MLIPIKISTLVLLIITLTNFVSLIYLGISILSNQIYIRHQKEQQKLLEYLFNKSLLSQAGPTYKFIKPENPFIGEMYFDKFDDNKLKIFDGLKWNIIKK